MSASAPWQRVKIAGKIIWSFDGYGRWGVVAHGHDTDTERRMPARVSVLVVRRATAVKRGKLEKFEHAELTSAEQVDALIAQLTESKAVFES